MTSYAMMLKKKNYLSNEERGDEIPEEKLAKETDKFDDSSSEREEGEELEDVFCCMTTWAPYREAPENGNPRRSSNSERSDPHGDLRQSRPHQPHCVHEGLEQPQRHHQSRFQTPYAQTSETIFNWIPENHISIRLPQQVSHEQANAVTRQPGYEERLEVLIRRYMSQQEESSSILFAKIDKVEIVLLGKINDTLSGYENLKRKMRRMKRPWKGNSKMSKRSRKNKAKAWEETSKALRS